MEQEIRRKEGDLSSLRYRAAGEGSEDTREKSLVYSFGDDGIYDPNQGSTASDGVSSFTGLGILSCVLIASAVAVLYGLVVMVVIPLLRRSRKGVRNGSDY